MTAADLPTPPAGRPAQAFAQFPTACRFALRNQTRNRPDATASRSPMRGSRTKSAVDCTRCGSVLAFRSFSATAGTTR
jgi:hypothetical protein